MKILKTIVGGRIVQQCLYDNISVKDADSYIARHEKSTIRTSYNRWQRNPVRALQSMIGANFSDGALFVTLTFSNETLPNSREKCSRRFEYFIRKLKGQGYAPIYIKCVEHLSSKHKRWHLHAIMDGVPAAAIEQAWNYYGIAKTMPIDIYQVLPNPTNVFDHCKGLASYMVKENQERPGQRLFQTSRGMKRPEVYRQLVDDSTQLAVPDDCMLIERDEPIVNIYGSVARQTYLMPASGN